MADSSEMKELPANTSPLTDDASIKILREQMIKFAILQLQDESLAEDAVQEALAGALKNARSFAGKSALKTWVFAILKNKIADILRHKKRLVDATSLGGNADEEDDFSSLFDRKGHWYSEERPLNWGSPEESFKQKEFWVVFETCLEGLPAKQARIFMMREYIGLDSEEICNTLALSTTNLHVILHRARLRLRECLENRWFEEKITP